MDEKNSPCESENQEVYDSPPEEVVENVVNVVTQNNPDGTVNRTTRRTKKVIVTTVRKICVSNTVPLNENNGKINESENSIQPEEEANKGLIINTITSEGDGGTSATFAYLPPTTKVSECVVDESSENGERKTRTHTTTTSISATALLNTRSKYTTKSSTSPDRLLKFYNPDSISEPDQKSIGGDEDEVNDLQDVKNYTLPDGSKVVKKRSKVCHVDGASAEKEHISVIPNSKEDNKDGQIITAEKRREKLQTNNSSRTMTTTTTVTKRILSSPFPKVFKNYFGRNEKRTDDVDNKNDFDVFPDFWDLNIGDDDMARKQIIESEKHFREQFKQLQTSMNKDNQPCIMSETADVNGQSVVIKKSTFLNSQPGELLRGNGSLFESFFSGMPLYQSYGMLAHNDGKQTEHSDTTLCTFKNDHFQNSSNIFSYLEDLTSKAFRDSNLTTDSEDNVISLSPDHEFSVDSASPEVTRKLSIMREPTIDENNLQEVGEQLAAKEGPNRVAWSEMPEVIQSNFVRKLTRQKIQLQEAMFEVITSEASYYHSLTILVDHFYNAPQFNVDSETSLDEEKSKTPSDIISENESSFSDEKVLKPIEKRHLFSNVLSVCLASRSFLQDLESRWIKTRPYLPEICDLIVKHASSKNFQPYIIYLRNQNYQIKTLKKLIQREEFRNVLKKLHSDPKTGKNHLDSFLALPMQRLTRLKMLVEVIQKLQHKILNNCEKEKESEENSNVCSVKKEHVDNADKALNALKTLLSGCENEQKLMDQKSRILDLSKATVFPDNVKAIAFGSKFIVKEGELKCRNEGKHSMLKIWPPKKSNAYYLILFHDLLLITKSKGGKEARYIVLDYCNKDQILASLEELNSRSTPPMSIAEESGNANPYLIPMTNVATSNASSLIGSFKAKNIGKTITSEINPQRTNQKQIKRSSSSNSAKNANNINRNDISKSPNSPSLSPIDVSNSYLYLTLKETHNGTFNEMKLFANSQTELLAWLNAFQKPFTF